MEALAGSGASVSVGVGKTTVGTTVTLGTCARVTASPIPPNMIATVSTSITLVKAHLFAFIFSHPPSQTNASAEFGLPADVYTIPRVALGLIGPTADFHIRLSADVELEAEAQHRRNRGIGSSLWLSDIRPGRISP
jgi:hypothetical protein